MHAIILIEIIAASSLDTVESPYVKDLNTMLDHGDSKAPEPKGNKDDLWDPSFLLFAWWSPLLCLVRLFWGKRRKAQPTNFSRFWL
jgi:hypothetical protein